MKYYNFTEQEVLDLEAQMPPSIAFAFQEYGSWFVSQKTIDDIDKIHGNLISLAIKEVFNDTRENILALKESLAYETYTEYNDKTDKGFDAYRKIEGGQIDPGTSGKDNPFAEINGVEVWVGSEIEGFVVEAIEADRVVLRDDNGPLILRVP